MQWGSIEASVTLPGGKRVEKSALPNITLYNSLHQAIQKSVGGYLFAKQVPVGTYTLVFDQIEDYNTPEPVSIQVGANEVAGPVIGNYQPGSGSLIIDYDTGEERVRLDRIRFWLVGPDGQRTMYPKPVKLKIILILMDIELN